MTLRKRLVLALVPLVVAAALWLPCVHFFFTPPARELVSSKGVAPLPRKLANRHVELWTRPELLQVELSKMRTANAEWDFMGRSFLAWSLANMALRDPATKQQSLEVMDRIIDQTLQLESVHGLYFFLMPYGRSAPFLQRPARSQFIDGEIALMLGMRCVVQDKPAYRQLLRERVELIVNRMNSSPSLSAESYPDECWTFCNTVALAAIRTADYLDGSDHSDLIRRWVALAKTRLDPRTGMMVSAYRLDGRTIYASEGTSIWVSAHCLAVVDEPFARQQYELARQKLGGRCLGFGFAREWAEGCADQMDVDSGLVIPGLGASVGSSGLAFIAAGTFGDVEYLRSLAASLNLAAFPVQQNGGLRFEAGNQVGDAVVLYGLVAGPMWQKVRAGT